MGRFLALFIVLALLGSAQAQDLIGGEAPRYTGRTLTVPPFAAAVRARHWAPGLNEGYVPQGLTFADGRLLVGAYRSTDPQQNRGPARVFAVDPRTGAVVGGFDLPATVGHADGLAAGRDGRLYVADNSRRLLVVDRAASLAAGQARVIGERRMAAGDENPGTNFLSFDGTRLWFGRYARDGQARIFAARPDRMFGAKEPFQAADAERSLPLPLFVQGATFDADGKLWIAASNSRFGRFYRLEPTDGRVLAEHDGIAGLEDLARDDAGRLWVLGEAGSQRWLNWSSFYPLLFALDIRALR